MSNRVFKTNVSQVDFKSLAGKLKQRASKTGHCNPLGTAVDRVLKSKNHHPWITLRRELPQHLKSSLATAQKE